MTTREFHDGRVRVLHADCREALRALPDASVDSVVTDPPYHLTSIVKRFGKPGSAPAKDYSGERDNATGAYARASKGFMGKTWDGGDIAFQPELWAQVLRVLKPGGYLLAFSGTRTVHRMTSAIEDAGFEIRDEIDFGHDGDAEIGAFLASLNPEQAAQFGKLFAECGEARLAWIYGSGFPKSLDVSKAIDKAAGAERLGTGEFKRAAIVRAGVGEEWAGGAFASHNESIKRVPITSPATSAARQWEGWGTALKPAIEPICVARRPLSEASVAANVLKHGTGGINIEGCKIHAEDAPGGDYVVKRLKPGATLNKTGGNWRPEEGGESYSGSMTPGRWPANFAHDRSVEVEALFPESDGQRATVGPQHGEKTSVNTYGDSGSAARFFYSAKADADDRLGSKHPTVKPLDLMRWLVRLVTPPGGLVLDPFAGTGVTGHAALLEGFRAILVEREAEYVADIARRLDHVFASQRERAQKIVVTLGKAADAGPLFGGTS